MVVGVGRGRGRGVSRGRGRGRKGQVSLEGHHVLVLPILRFYRPLWVWVRVWGGGER